VCTDLFLGDTDFFRPSRISIFIKLIIFSPSQYTPHHSYYCLTFHIRVCHVFSGCTFSLSEGVDAWLALPNTSHHSVYSVCYPPHVYDDYSASVVPFFLLLLPVIHGFPQGRVHTCSRGVFLMCPTVLSVNL